jgi:hypothetical protein
MTSVPAAEEQTQAPSSARGRAAQLAWIGIIVGVCAIASIVATWPLGLYLFSAIPLGTEREATVPLFNLWTLWWTADRATQGFNGYWNAPIFYPTPGAFTFSEPQPLTGLLVAPLWSLGLPLALIYNLALLLLLTLNGVFAYRLSRALNTSPAAALLAAVLTITLPFVAKIAGVLQLTALFGMLWTLEGLLGFGKSGGTRWAAWAGAGFVATYLTCQQYALMFAPFAVGAALLALAQRDFRRDAWLKLGIAGLTTAGIVAAVALPALTIHRQMGLARSEDIVQALSARLGDFFTRPEHAIVSVPAAIPSDTAGLFPGLLLALLAGYGIWIGTADPQQRPWAIFLAASTVAAIVLALGLNISIAGWRPFATLRAIVPGLSGLRSPFRFAVLMQLCLPILAALAISALLRDRALLARSALVVVGLLAALENLSLQPSLVGVPADVRAPWTNWLAAQPTSTVVAHIPFPAGVHVSDYEIETWRMLGQIRHHKPIVNGYSGYFPQTLLPNGQIIPSYNQFQLGMAELFPDRATLCTLSKGLGVNTLVVDRSWITQQQAKLDTQRAFLQPIYSDDQFQIFQLAAPSGACQERP